MQHPIPVQTTQTSTKEPTMVPSSSLAIKDGTVGSLANLGVEPVGVGVVGC